MSHSDASSIQLSRSTSETQASCALDVHGVGRAEISTGLGMLDHLLESLVRHAGFDLLLSCDGDLHVDDHHTVEDCAILLGRALLEAQGERRGIERFGWAFVPLDEALARAVVDLSGRPSPRIRLDLRRERLGDVATENLTHFLNSLAIEARIALHVDVLRGENDHHRAEAAFKATARALRAALTSNSTDDVPSTKGVLG